MRLGVELQQAAPFAAVCCHRKHVSGIVSYCGDFLTHLRARFKPQKTTVFRRAGMPLRLHYDRI